MHFQLLKPPFRSILLAGVVGSVLMLPTSLPQAAPVDTTSEIVDALNDAPTTLTGTYLSAKVAQDNQDLALAAHFFAQALEKQPENQLLLERNFALTLAIGDHDTAFKLAERMAEMQAAEETKAQEQPEGEESEAESAHEPNDDTSHRITPMVHLALGVKALKGKSFGSAVKNFEAGLYELENNPVDLMGPTPFQRSLNDPRLLSASAQYGPFAVITQSILKAWAIIGDDRNALDAALAALQIDDEGEVNQFFFSLHSGLIATYAKDYAKASQYLKESLVADPNSPSTAEALINVLLKAEKVEEAQKVLDDFMQSAADKEEKDWMLATFEPMKPVASPIRTPQDGAAELFSTLGDALSQERAIEGGALYLQFADYLREDHDRTVFAIARLFERMRKDGRALDYYTQIDGKSALFRKAQRNSAFVLTRLERPDEAISQMQTLLENDGADLESVSVLSRIYQSQDRFKDSIKVLTQGLNSIDEKRDIHWSLYFLRGSAYDQVKDWPNTEKDMLAALELFPNQPTVLNYLGYSWVDRGLHLDRAIEMIRQAVALRPYDGFFVDSLGWAHYRLGEFEEAVTFLERAVELRPDDPTITDHLGDAYWKAGRQNEARFQWERVKTMQPKDDLLKQVDEKIKNGLVDKDPS